MPTAKAVGILFLHIGSSLSGPGGFLSVLPGRTIKGFLKTSAEIAGGAKTAVFADLMDAHICFQQHAGGHTDPVIMDVSDCGNLKTTLETAGAFPLTDGCCIGDIL